MDPASTEPFPPAVRRFRRGEGTASTHTVELHDEQTLPVRHERLGRLVLHTLSTLRVPTTQVDVSLVDVPHMAALNETHMGHEGPTDVLAFPLDDPTAATAGIPSLLGDVVLCPSVAEEQAVDDPEAELELLLVHGILHLLGHDHAEAEERATMFNLTDEVLAGFRRSEDEPQERRDGLAAAGETGGDR